MLSEIIASTIAFFSTFFITPILMKFLYQANVVALDLHKKNKPKLPSAGGLAVAFGVLAGLLSYVGIKTFVYGLQQQAIYFLAVISSVLIVTFVGFIDDLNITKRKVKIKGREDIRIGLPQWLKPLLTLPAAIPLMVIMAGQPTMSIPFFGDVNFGIFYPLVLVPIGVVGASNAVNLLGGFNGMEAGMGIVYMLSLGIYALLHDSISAVVFLVSFASLLAFIRYNWYPAKILPGDSLTYLLGSLVASGVIIGNMEKAGVIVLMPFIIEFFLKARSKFQASCLGKLRKDGKLDPPYGKKIYSLTHVLMNLKPLTEEQVAMLAIFIVAIFSTIIFLV
jgi:UDP-N-acetylglucosamine--dolichyl-phosphate N-acetylglucosaminephosphotransferase